MVPELLGTAPLFHQFSGWIWTGTGLALSLAYGRRHHKDLFILVTAGTPIHHAMA